MKFYTLKNDKKAFIVSNTALNDENFLELLANTQEATLEKHLPVVTIEKNTVKVVVGSVAHPMTEAHLIVAIVLKTDKKIQVANLSSQDLPEETFVLEEGEKPLEVYEYCNLHGLWKTEIKPDFGIDP